MDQQPAIPSPAVFQGLSSTKPLVGPGASGLPTPAECATHLELLEAFRTLRVQVLESTGLDAIFDIKPEPRTVTRGSSTKKLKDDTFAERRRKKWPLFIDLAVARFKIWFENVDEDLGSRNIADGQSQEVIVPPLDILIVWHAFLLNPKSFAKHCETSVLTRIRKVAFPWSGVYAAIDAGSPSFSFSAPTTDGVWRNGVLVRDLFAYLSRSTISSNLSGILRSYGRKDRLLATNLAGIRLDAIEQVIARCCAEAHNNPPFNRSLADAVKRQVSFIDKMHAQLWIRSPALEDTMERAVRRYGQFLQLFKLHPLTMLVPTLDIDLAWHTAQLSHYHYRLATVERAGRFIDHDDKLGQEALAPGMDKTQELWRIHFAKEYRTCLCWDCEALLSAVDGSEASEDQDGDDALANEVQKDVEHHRAVELARRRGKPLPANAPKITRPV